MKKIIVIYFYISIAYQIGFSQGYFPLQVGNQWDFGMLNWPAVGYQYMFSIKVLGDTIMPNSKTYAIVLDGYRGGILYKRQEGSILYNYAPTGDIVEHDFASKSGDTTAMYMFANDTVLTIVTVSIGEIFGRNLQYWRYHEDAVHGGMFDGWSWLTITDSLGYTYFADFGGNYHCLGIKVDGKIYGTITNVSDESSGSPTKFQLFQNYPNPFNPTTEIDFVIPKATYTTLKIYDILGREVSTLISKELMAGHYSRKWNAAGFSSGIYFYTLRSGSFIETKKLFLQK